MTQQIGRHERADARCLKELETENGRLKKLLAEHLLKNDVIKEALRKESRARHLVSKFARPRPEDTIKSPPTSSATTHTL